MKVLSIVGATLLVTSFHAAALFLYRRCLRGKMRTSVLLQTTDTLFLLKRSMLT
uniref:hypothetical protein n=1 Tax=Klebsiella pneumoniae TaxID=573 RepID=UPI003703AAF8